MNQRLHDAAFRCIEGLGMPKEIANLLMERIIQELKDEYRRGAENDRPVEEWKDGD